MVKENYDLICLHNIFEYNEKKAYHLVGSRCLGEVYGGSRYNSTENSGTSGFNIIETEIKN